MTKYTDSTSLPELDAFFLPKREPQVIHPMTVVRRVAKSGRRYTQLMTREQYAAYRARVAAKQEA